VVLFMVSNLLHYSFGVWLFDRRVRWFTVWKVPTVVAAFLGLLVSITQFEVWPPLLTSIRMLGEISIPLMLFGLGVRIASSRIESIGFGLFGAVLRPAIGMGLAWLILQLITLPRTEQALLLVFGALPPAVLNFMFAERYHQEPEKVASMVLIGNLASVLFLSLALALVLN
jgi:predicted permease